MTEGVSPPIRHDQQLKQRTLGGILWTLSEASVQVVLRTILLLVLARITGPEAFGVIGAAMVVIHVAAVIGQLGLSQALVQKAELGRSYVRVAFTAAISWGVSVTCGVVLLAPAVGSFFGFDGLEDVLKVIAFIPLMSNAGLVAEGLLQRSFAFKKIAVVSATSFVLGFGVVGVALALVGGGVWALVAAYVTETAIRTFLLMVIQPHPKQLCFDRATLRDVTAFGGGFTGWRLAQVTAQSVDNVVVGRCLGAEAMGLYGRAYQITSIPNAFLGRALVMVLLPIMSRVQQDLPRLGSVYCRISSVLALVTLPAAAVVIILAPELVLVVLGSAWEGVILPLQLLAPGIFFRLAFQVNNATLTAAGVIYSAAWRQSLFAANVLVGALVGQYWGLPGVAAGVCCAMVVHFVVSSVHSMRVTSLHLRDFLFAHTRGLFLALLVATGMFAGVHLLRNAGVSPSWTMAISAVVITVSLLLSLKLFPKTFLGSDVIWVVNFVIAGIRDKARPPRS